MADAATAPKLPREVAVRAADGTVGTVLRKDLAQALDAGAEVVGGEELRKAKAEAQYGGLGGELKAAGLGALRTATLGLSDVALTGGSAFGDAKQNRAMLSGYAEANPLATTGGELVGAVAPALLTGGVATPAGAVGALGSAAERGVGSLLGKGMLGKAAGMAVQGAVEGGAFGLGSAVSEAAIQDHDLTAEQVLASAGKGALFGGAIGGGLGLAGAGLKYAGGKALDLLPEALGAEGGTAATKAKALAEEFAFDAAGPMLKDARKLAKYGQDPAKLGRFMLDELPAAGKKPFAAMTREEIGEAAAKVADDYGQRIGRAIDDIDAAATVKGVTPDARSIMKRVADEVVKPLDALPGYEGVTSKVQKYMESWGERTGVLARDANGMLVESGTTGTATFKDLKKFREGLDDLIFRGNKALSDDPIVKELRQVRSILEEEIGTQSGKLGDASLQAEYQTAKEGYRSAKTVSDIAADRALRQNVNRMASLTDYISGGAALAGGLASGNPLGALAGIGLGAANKVLRERGNQMVAGLLDSASRINALKSLSVSFGEGTQKAAQSLVTGARRLPTATVASGAGRTKATAKTIDQIQELASNPGALSQRLSTQVDAGVAPNVATAYGMAATRAITYLASQAPKGQPISPAFPTVTRPPSKLELMQFQRKLDVFEDPIGTTSRAIKGGELTMEHVQALEAMYPRVLQELRMATMERFGEMAQKGKLPPYERRVQLGTLLGVPLDASQDPAFMAAQQEIAAQMGQPQAQPPPRMVGKPPVQAGNMETTSDRLEKGES